MQTPGYSTVARISFGLAALTLSILFLSHLLELLPDNYRIKHEARSALVETVAMASTLAVKKKDVVTIKLILTALVERDPDVLSAGVRKNGGELLLEVGEHNKLWQANKVGDRSFMYLAVPIFQNEEAWGNVEVRFKPIDGASPFASIIDSAIVRLIFFVGLIAFIAYVFYMRRVLKHLDPGRVIPKRVQAMLNTLSEGVLVLDDSGCIVLANKSIGESLNLPASQLIGVEASKLPWRDPDMTGMRPSKEHSNDYPWEQIIKRKESNGDAIGLYRSRINTGTRVFNVNATPIAAENGYIRGVMVSFDDITNLERKNTRLRKTLASLKKSRDEISQQNKKLHELATRDPLTGCMNRRAFFEVLEPAWSAARRHHHALSVIMVDLDHFKSVNDQYGHARGDEVLKTVAQILKTLCRDHDYVGRFGGEEFCILINFGTVKDSIIAAERFRAGIAAQPIAGLNQTASLGVATLSADVHTPQDLINRADDALYVAKKGGRNRVVHHSMMNENCAEGAVEPERAV
jgi:diguanylate cyclase (GGDEF)-like protein